jgi:hypothetical protein
MSEENLGFYAAQQVDRTADIIELLAPLIDNENSTEKILKAANEINRSTWELKNAIERDLSEKEDK